MNDSPLGMSDRIHRFSMFVGGMCSGFVGITGVGNILSPQELGYIALVGAVAVMGGTLWRTYFPDQQKVTVTTQVTPKVTVAEEVSKSDAPNPKKK